MYKPLQDLLSNWGQNNLIGESRAHNSILEAIAENEYLIILEMKIKVNIGGYSEVITERRFYPTKYQNNDVDYLDPNKDVVNLEKIMEIMEWDFLNKQSKAVDRLIQKFNPDGFF